jgi:hypothetical protein
MRKLFPLLVLSLLCLAVAGYAQRATPPAATPKAEQPPKPGAEKPPAPPKPAEPAKPAEPPTAPEAAKPAEEPKPTEKPETPAAQPRRALEDRMAFEGCIPTDQLPGIPAGLGGAGDERKAARDEIMKRGDEAVPDLMRATRACNNTIRWEAVNALGSLHAKQAVDALIERVLKDLDPHVEWRSIWALSSIRVDDEVRQKGLAALANPANDFERWRAAILLSNFDAPECVPVILEGLKAEDQWEKWEAVNALGRVHNKDTVEALRPIAKDPQSRIRGEAALVLGRMKEKDAVSVLAEMLNDADENVRWRAAMALGQAGFAEGIEPLQQRLAVEEDEHTKGNIQRSLDRLQGKRPEARKPQTPAEGGAAKPAEGKKPAAEAPPVETAPK